MTLGGFSSNQRRHQEQVDDGPGRELQPGLFPGEEDDRGAVTAAAVQGRKGPDQDPGQETLDHAESDQEIDVDASEEFVDVVGGVGGVQRGWKRSRRFRIRIPEQAHHCQVQARLAPI